MSLGAIDLSLLVPLEALLEEKNVTHAGFRLNTSQSAMSGSLARLRRHFNDELLVRVGREYELTPLAERLLPVVQASLRKPPALPRPDDRAARLPAAGRQ
ncbi:LysR family transcriptional regulator [Streptomyces sp. NPDC058457]|uniref:LysR family transcriptional regulator n=1 Tax=Streptomyces sp. NPDC058457 TaxID=3346507 RepID=UPI00365345B4